MQDNQENREIRGGVADYTMIKLPSASADSIKSFFLSLYFLICLHYICQGTLYRLKTSTVGAKTGKGISVQ